MHYYSLHVGDYTKDTVGLSLIEHGAYVLLMNWAYANERPLPLEMERLFRICSAIKKEDKKAVEIVVNQFFQKETDGYTHKRIITEIRKFYKKSDAGKANVGKRWHQEDEASDTNPHTKQTTNPDTSEESNHNARNYNQEPRSKNHTSAPSPPSEGPSAFSSISEAPKSHTQPTAAPPRQPDSTKKKKGGAAPRKRWVIFDALLTACGMPLTGLTKTEGGRVAAAKKQIVDTFPPIVSDECEALIAQEIAARARRYREKWPRVDLTPTALSANWSQLAGAKKETGRVSQGIGEPSWDWRGVARDLGITADLWALLERGDKIKIIRKQAGREERA